MMATNLEFNSTCSPLVEELLEGLDSISRGELYEFLDKIHLLKMITSPDRKYPKDLERWDDPRSSEKKLDPNGKIYVDLCNPHILTDMDYFRPAAKHFEEFGCYTKFLKNPDPSSDFMQFWTEERNRCLNGYTRDYDGEWIPGYFYHYLNYGRVKIKVKTGKKRAYEKEAFPKVYDSDYWFFHYVEQGEYDGEFGSVLKKRRWGYSYKLSNMCNRNYVHSKSAKSYILASQKEYIYRDGPMPKFKENLAFIESNTPFWSPRTIDTLEHTRAGYKDPKLGIEKGRLSEVIGVTCKDDPDKGRGKAAKLVAFEEFGVFPQIEKTWTVTEESVKQGELVYGYLIAGGCVCAGTKVWNNEGNLVNIEDLNVTKGILGFDDKEGKVSTEVITYWQPPTEKPCYRITTNTGRFLECSEDHPILWSRKALNYTPRAKDSAGKCSNKRIITKKSLFREAKDIKIGEQIAVINEVNIFGTRRMWQPRLVGWLIGDGSYGHDKTPVLSNCEDEINQYLSNNFDIKVEKQYTTKTGKLYKETRIKGICRNLRELGIYGQTKLAKTLPKEIHSYCKEDLLEFIGGLFDTDGYVTKEGRISICSMSFSLLQEMQLLLQKFGIHGNIYTKKKRVNNPKDKNDYYNLEIARKDSVLIFVKNVSLFPKFKQDRLNTFEEVFKNRKNQHSKKLHGFRFERVVKKEYIGMKPIYNLTASTTHTYIANGIITHNTGGSEGSDFTGAEKMHYNPQAYNIKSIRNIYSKTNGNGICGMFVPAYLSFEECYDENGNSDVIAALVRILRERQKIRLTSRDSNRLIQKKAEIPITPEEAVLRREGSIFPILDIKEILSSIVPSLDHFVSGHYVGYMNIELNGDIKFIHDTHMSPIRKYPAPPDIDKRGAIEIFEMPKKVSDSYRYICGIDPYDDDFVEYSESLGSIIVFDRWTRRIVAEYTGRMQTAAEFYEIVYRLARFYNATIMYENNKKGLFAYFANIKKATTMLADTPEFIGDKQVLKPRMLTGNTSKGVNATTAINAMGRRLQADWMVELAYADEFVDEEDELKEDLAKLTNLHKIRSIGYLQEAETWNPDGNFDRISAMNMVMIYDAELQKFETGVRQEKIKTITDDPFFDKHFRKSNPAIQKYFSYTLR